MPHVEKMSPLFAKDSSWGVLWKFTWSMVSSMKAMHGHPMRKMAPSKSLESNVESCALYPLVYHGLMGKSVAHLNDSMILPKPWPLAIANVPAL